MNLLDAINTMKSNIDQANALVAQLNPLHEAFTVELEKIKDLDRNSVYFGVNADGTATIVKFDAMNSAPSFITALPLPDEAQGVPESPAPTDTVVESSEAVQPPLSGAEGNPQTTSTV